MTIHHSDCTVNVIVFSELHLDVITCAKKVMFLSAFVC